MRLCVQPFAGSERDEGQLSSLKAPVPSRGSGGAPVLRVGQPGHPAVHPGILSACCLQGFALLPAFLGPWLGEAVAAPPLPLEAGPG